MLVLLEYFILCQDELLRCNYNDQLLLLKKGLPNVKILKIADSYKSQVHMTLRQEEILWKAYSFGYFKYSRDITLTDLAKLLKIFEATLSQTLRIVEEKAVKQLLEK